MQRLARGGGDLTGGTLMTFVAGGTIRNGSTFAFDVVSELLSRTGPVRTRSANHLDASASA